MHLKRADVYIANIVKCRPPENRDPLPDEVAACAGYLDRQIRLVGPKGIVALGTADMVRRSVDRAAGGGNVVGNADLMRLVGDMSG